MSWSDRRQVLGSLAAVALLGGCFRPMLAEDAPARGMIGRIAFPDFDDRFGYYLNESLTDRLGRPRDPAWRLEIKTHIDKQDLAIAQNNAVTRISLVAVADWMLYAGEGAEPVLKDRTVTQSGYNSTASLFATRQAKLDIERRLARDLGERIARAVLARAGTLAAAGAGQAGS